MSFLVGKTMQSAQNGYDTPKSDAKFKIKDLLMTPMAERKPAQLVRNAELPYFPLFEEPVKFFVKKEEIGPTETAPDTPTIPTPPSSLESFKKVAERPQHWAPQRPSAMRRLGFQNEPQDPEPSDSDAPSTPLRPTQAAKRTEMLLRAPKASNRMAPARFAYERSLGGNRHTNNATPKKARRVVDLEIYTPERNRRAQLEQVRACYKRV